MKKYETSILDCIKTEYMKIVDGIHVASNISADLSLDTIVSPPPPIDSIDDVGFWHKHRTKCIVCAVKTLDNNRFVDVGGGDGANAKALEEAGYDVAVFEPRPASVLKARQRGVRNIIQGYFDATTVKENSVPAIGLFDVIEHVENDHEFVRNMRPLLTDDSFVVATVPAHMYLWSEKDEFAHQRRYSLRQFKKLFSENGYRVVYATYFFTLLLPIMYFMKALPYKFRKNRKSGQAVAASEKIVIQKKLKKEHKTSKFAPILSFEHSIIAKGKKLPFGASILLIAANTRTTH